jgi:micrococcal nuclease
VTLRLRHVSCLALAAPFLAACGDDGVRGDAGAVDSGGDADGGAGGDSGPPYDPTVGNSFDGPLDLDDSRVTMMAPMGLPASASPCREPILGRVRFVTDGDTISVNGISEPLSESVRLIGVDSPEIAHDGTAADCYGPEAAEFTGQLRNHIVWLTFDAECVDRFGRLLAYVWVGEGPQDMWERQMLRRGFGTQLTISPNTAHSDTLRQDELAAQREGTGLWSACR